MFKQRVIKLNKEITTTSKENENTRITSLFFPLVRNHDKRFHLSERVNAKHYKLLHEFIQHFRNISKTWVTSQTRVWSRNSETESFLRTSPVRVNITRIHLYPRTQKYAFLFDFPENPGPNKIFYFQKIPHGVCAKIRVIKSPAK